MIILCVMEKLGVNLLYSFEKRAEKITRLGEILFHGFASAIYVCVDEARTSDLSC